MTLKSAAGPSAVETQAGASKRRGKRWSVGMGAEQGGAASRSPPAADSRESKAVGPFHAWSSSSFLLVVIGIVVLTLVAAVSSPHLLADTRTLCWYKEDAVTKLVAAVRRGACGAVGERRGRGSKNSERGNVLLVGGMGGRVVLFHARRCASRGCGVRGFDDRGASSGRFHSNAQHGNWGRAAQAKPHRGRGRPSRALGN